LSGILVVDDEPDLRAIARRVLERAGHEVREAGDGQAALDLVGQSPPDLILTDIMMPLMDGYELIRRIQADPATAEIPILAMSGFYPRPLDADVRIISKPYRLRELVTAVEDLLARTRGETRP
jgi:CheY-like chemotaxis protein